MGASALIVHAPTLENQFVAGGFSYQTTGTGPSTNPFGSAIWTNDFVLAGPTGDPAGVAANGANNIAQAFVDVATAGVAGKATFVSRGGTAGTTTEEHAIWADVNTAGLTPTGVTLCAVPASLGGGLTPIAPGGVATNGAACPGGVLPGSAGGGTLPTWYVITGADAGPERGRRQRLHGATRTTGANSCYVFTDRGTYDYLASGIDPAGSVPNLKIVTRGPQPSTAPGGQYALINYFHAYVLNPNIGAERQPHRRAGLRQLPDVADGAERAAELSADVGHRRPGRTAVRRHRQPDGDDRRAGDPGKRDRRYAGHADGQHRQQGGRLPAAQRRHRVGRSGRQRPAGGGTGRDRDDRRERELHGHVRANGQR